MRLGDLEVYCLSREAERNAWKIFKRLDWDIKKSMGLQWIRSVDSVGANIAEGFGRFHYLDKNKFNYNSRGSLLEAVHWTELLLERGFISTEESEVILALFRRVHIMLNNYINVTKQQSKQQSK